MTYEIGKDKSDLHPTVLCNVYCFSLNAILFDHLFFNNIEIGFVKDISFSRDFDQIENEIDLKTINQPSDNKA